MKLRLGMGEGDGEGDGEVVNSWRGCFKKRLNGQSRVGSSRAGLNEM